MESRSLRPGERGRYVAGGTRFAMSMPGFNFYFRCESCNSRSDAYSVYPFPDLFRPEIILPAWSVAHQSWAQVQLSLTAEQRAHIESDPKNLNSFASSLTSSAFTVFAPQLSIDRADQCAVIVTPAPHCPRCHCACDSVFGYPPTESRTTIPELSAEEFDTTPLSMIEFSVRSRNICYSLGIKTLGQLRKHRDAFAKHKQASPLTILEVDRWLEIKPNTENAT